MEIKGSIYGKGVTWGNKGGSGRKKLPKVFSHM